MIVYLAGYMGSGKSTIGRMVAREIGFGFLDTDREVEKAAGMSVGDIFAGHGEARFRELEEELLCEISGSQEDLVVATGGGMPCFGSNMDTMLRTGKVVYLKSGTARLMGRLGPGREKRPLIRGMSDAQLERYIGDTLEKREVYYMRAGVTIDCDGASDEYITRHIVSYIEAEGGGR